MHLPSIALLQEREVTNVVEVELFAIKTRKDGIATNTDGARAGVDAAAFSELSASAATCLNGWEDTRVAGNTAFCPESTSYCAPHATMLCGTSPLQQAKRQHHGCMACAALMMPGTVGVLQGTGTTTLATIFKCGPGPPKAASGRGGPPASRRHR